MEQSWFEMHELRGRRLGTGTWIPLRASKVLRKEGQWAEVGYLEVYEGVGTVGFPVASEKITSTLGWSDIGPGNPHAPWARDEHYDPADAYASRGDAIGLHLVLTQSGYGKSPLVWHLHQDFALALDLYREGDSWVRPIEGYVEVAKLLRNADSHPIELLVRTEHLKDYLAARHGAADGKLLRAGRNPCGCCAHQLGRKPRRRNTDRLLGRKNLAYSSRWR